MKGSADPKEKQGEFAASELADRLLRRATAPIGVIDVRHPLQLHARTAGWVAEKFGLLAEFNHRYGADQSAAAASQNMPLGVPRVSSSAAFESSVPSSLVTDTAAPVQTEASPQLRVRRPGMAEANSSSVRSESSPTVQGMPVPQISHSAPGSPAARFVQRKTATATEAAVIARKTDDGQTTSVEDSHGGEPSVLGNGATSDPGAFAQAQELHVSSQGVPEMVLQRKETAVTSNASLLELASVPQVSEMSSVSSSPTSMHLQRMVDPAGNQTVAVEEVPVAGKTVLNEANGAARQPSNGHSQAQAASLPRTPEISKPVSAGAQMPLQRKEIDRPDATPQRNGTASSAPAAVAREISIGRAAPANAAIVWRKADVNVSRPVASPSVPAPVLSVPVHTEAAPQIMRQVGDSPASGANAGDLAEQVKRIISRELTVERERRGRGKWA
jgi:hypothetical protein